MKLQTVTIKEHLPLEHKLSKRRTLVSLFLQLYLWYQNTSWAPAGSR